MNKTLRSRRRANRFHTGKSIFKQLICYHYKTPVIFLKGERFHFEKTKDRISGYILSSTPIPDISFENIREQLPMLIFR